MMDFKLGPRAIHPFLQVKGRAIRVHLILCIFAGVHTLVCSYILRNYVIQQASLINKLLVSWNHEKKLQVAYSLRCHAAINRNPNRQWAALNT